MNVSWIGGLIRVLGQLAINGYMALELDEQILRMRMGGNSLKKIAGAYEDYVSGEYGSFLYKHTK